MTQKEYEDGVRAATDGAGELRAEWEQLRADLAAARAELAEWRVRVNGDMDAYLDAATWGAREEMHRRALATLAAERAWRERLRRVAEAAARLRSRWWLNTVDAPTMHCEPDDTDRLASALDALHHGDLDGTATRTPAYKQS